jgi:pyruvate/2-oxoglutarate dehydrogenase complex dihydrolipoamide acyltransferase (E2) component
MVRCTITNPVLLLLIRSTLIALNQANVTGNYSVLRDLAAPSFREANSLEKLTQIFARIRQRNLDLAPILLIQPKLYRKAEITPKGMLRITGFFEIDPERVNFDLLYQPVQGRWRLFGISANASEPQQPPTSLPIEDAQPPEAAPPAKSTAAPNSTPEKPNPPEAGGGAPKSPPKTETDVRDRLDNPPSPPPEEDMPKGKSSWNPFDR